MGITRTSSRGRFTIDTDAPPRAMRGFTIIEPQRTYGTIVWDPDELELYQNYQGKALRPCTWIYERVKSMRILPVVILDRLLEQPYAWPKAWRPARSGKDMFVHFWGTLYLDDLGSGPWVRFGYWDSGYLEEGMTSIERSHHGHDSFTALLR